MRYVLALLLCLSSCGEAFAAKSECETAFATMCARIYKCGDIQIALPDGIIWTWTECAERFSEDGEGFAGLGCAFDDGTSYEACHEAALKIPLECGDATIDARSVALADAQGVCRRR